MKKEQQEGIGGKVMKIVAVMPIKLHNERLPGKNTKMLNGRPLLQYELDTLRETGMCGDIFVYCSDEGVVRFLPPGVKFLKRPEALDLPTANFTQIFESFSSEVDADIYVYAHATAPYISKRTMTECIKAVSSGRHDSAFCAVKIQDFLWYKGKPLNFDARDLPRSQDLDPIYRETSGVYVFKKEVFYEYGGRIGRNPYIKEVGYREAVDVNTPEDFRLAEILATEELDEGTKGEDHHGPF